MRQGFFFERDERLYLITSRHVVYDEACVHFLDQIRIALHTSARNVASLMAFEIPLYRNGRGVWHKCSDSAGAIDIATIELDMGALPSDLVYSAFSIDHLAGDTKVKVGTQALIVGIHSGFQDALHQLPVARQAIVAACLDLRFQGQRYFLTDARMHRGLSGAPVVARISHPDASQYELPWRLLGVHSARSDVGTRDIQIDERLGRNCAWFADALLSLSSA